MEIVPAHDEVQSFYFNGMVLRGLLVNGEPWFIASDLAKILEYRMPSDMTRVLADEDKGTHLVRTLGGNQNLSIISEPAFYQLVVQRQSGWIQKKSSREMVKEFQKWVTHDVLPQIRKTGSYGVAQVKELSGAELMAKALIEAQNVLAAKDERIAELEPKADVYDIVMKDSAYGFRDIVQSIRSEIPVKENLVRERIKELDWQRYHQKEVWDEKLGCKKKVYWSTTPTSAIDKGYVVMEPQGKHNGKDRMQPKFTEKALHELIDFFTPDTNQEMLEIA